MCERDVCVCVRDVCVCVCVCVCERETYVCGVCACVRERTFVERDVCVEDVCAGLFWTCRIAFPCPRPKRYFISFKAGFLKSFAGGPTCCRV